MRTAKTILTLTVMLVVLAAVYVSAQQTPAPAPAQPAPAPAQPAPAQPAQQPAAGPSLKDLAGKWTGWATPTSGAAFPIEVQIQPDGSYTSMMGATSGRGNIKMDGGKLTAEGQLSGPVGTAGGTGRSQLTVADKGGKKVIKGKGRNDLGPFDYELTKQ